jgi:hypothetical protein
MVEDDGAEGTCAIGPEDRRGEGIAAIRGGDADFFLHQARPEETFLGGNAGGDAEPEA